MYILRRFHRFIPAALVITVHGVAFADPSRGKPEAEPTVPDLSGSPATPALSTEADRIAARRWGEEGKKKLEAGDIAGALDLFQRAHAILHQPDTALRLSAAHEALEHLVEARDALLEIMQMPVKRGESPALAEARAYAPGGVKALEAKIPRIILRVTGPSPGSFSAFIDGKPIEAARLTSPLLVNPGRHHIDLEAPRFNRVDKDVNVSATSGDEAEPLIVQIVMTKYAEPRRVPPVRPIERSGPIDTWVAAGIVATGTLGVASVVTGIGAAVMYAPVMNGDAEYQPRAAVIQGFFWSFAVTGGLAAAAGIGTLIYARRGGAATPTNEKNAVALVVLPSPDGVVVHGQW